MSGVREAENRPTPQPAHRVDDVIYAPLLLHEIQLFDAESGAYIRSGQIMHTVAPWLDAKVPASHATQLERPSTEEYVPGWHGTQLPSTP
jgi:hypothetical protein